MVVCKWIRRLSKYLLHYCSGRTYQRVVDDVVFLEHWGRHLGVLVIVVLDEGFVAHPGLLLDEHAYFGYFAEARCAGVTGFQDHDLGVLCCERKKKGRRGSRVLGIRSKYW